MGGSSPLISPTGELIRPILVYVRLLSPILSTGVLGCVTNSRLTAHINEKASKKPVQRVSRSR
nr:MAG TPA: hypothetical protein [Crassvirales sp.]